MRIAIAGASGRMGRMLIEAVSQSTDLKLTAALDIAGAPMLGQDACGFLGQNSGVLITDQLSAIQQADCLIDFTRPEGSLQHLAACVQYGVNMVIGTTGFDEAGKAAITRASESIGIVFAPNMSVGVNATLKLLDMAARILNSGYDVEVFEAHHRHKVDAPSGTALKMGETIAQAWVSHWTKSPPGHVTDIPVHAKQVKSAFQSCAEGISWAITQYSFVAPENALRSPTGQAAARVTLKGVCGPLAISRANAKVSLICRLF